MLNVVNYYWKDYYVNQFKVYDDFLEPNVYYYYGDPVGNSHV